MEDILVDYHLAKAVAQVDGNYDELSYRQSLYFQAILQKHGVTQAEFDSSLVYYYTRADRFASVYRRVVDRLQDQAVVLGASEGEIGRYATLNAFGDTANIWSGYSSILLIPTPPYHRSEFMITGDSLFRKGDTFLLQFMSDFVYQSGTKDGLVYLVVEYPDTVVVRQSRFTFSGLNQIRMDNPPDNCPKSVKGYFYVGGTHDHSTILRMAFLNNIQLIRFHKKNEEPAATASDSIASDSIAGRAVDVTVGSGDSVGRGRKMLRLGKGDSPNRVVERIDSVKTRH